MRVAVDLTKCQGYAQCTFLAPDVFTMHGDEALWYDPNPDETQRVRIQRAAAACPVQAILLDGTNDRINGRLSRANADSRDGGDEFKRSGRIVIVGASLAGLRAAAALREEGFGGALTLIEDEPFEPYDRPPLSKQVLGGRVPAEDVALPRLGELDAKWLLVLGRLRRHSHRGRPRPRLPEILRAAHAEVDRANIDSLTRGGEFAGELEHKGPRVGHIPRHSGLIPRCACLVPLLGHLRRRTPRPRPPLRRVDEF